MSCPYCGALCGIKTQEKIVSKNTNTLFITFWGTWLPGKSITYVTKYNTTNFENKLKNCNFPNLKIFTVEGFLLSVDHDVAEFVNIIKP